MQPASTDTLLYSFLLYDYTILIQCMFSWIFIFIWEWLWINNVPKVTFVCVLLYIYWYLGVHKGTTVYQRLTLGLFWVSQVVLKWSFAHVYLLCFCLKYTKCHKIHQCSTLLDIMEQLFKVVTNLHIHQQFLNVLMIPQPHQCTWYHQSFHFKILWMCSDLAL